MFTIKFYSDGGFRQRILTAESLTILRDQNGGGEITLHQKNPGDDTRIDIREDVGKPREAFWPQIYQKAIIENAAGKTTEIITLGPSTTAYPPSSEAPGNIANNKAA